MGGTGPSKLEQDFQILGQELPEKYIGIENKANICYANSVIQWLYFWNSFRDEVLNAQLAPDDNSLLSHIKAIFETMIQSKKRIGTINTKKFMNRVAQLNCMFEGDMHQDWHEFFIWLVNDISDYLNKLRKGRTWVQDLFEGKFTSQTKWLQCETVSHREEPFLDLSVDVEQNSSLLSCLRNFSSTETLNGQDKFFCDNCGCKQEATKRVVIKSLPSVLVCHLKRFKFNEDLQRYTKLGYRVAFPKELRLMNTAEDCEEKLYELIGIVIHIGAGIQFGHYIAIIKSFDHWIKFDDDYVEKVDEKLIQSIFGASRDSFASIPCGYLLFYKERSE